MTPTSGTQPVAPEPPGAPGDLPHEDEGREALSADEIRQRAVVGVALIATRGLAIRALGFVGSVVLARLLVPEDFGVLAFGLVFLVFGGLLGDAGVAAGLMRRRARPTGLELEAVLGFQLAMTLAVSAVVAAIGLAAGGKAGLVAAVMVLALPLGVVRTPTIVLLERELRYGRLATAEVLETVVFLVFSIALVVLGAGVWGVVVASLLKAISGSLFLLARSPVWRLRPRIAVAPIRSLLSFGFKMQAVGAITTLRGQGLNLATAAVAGLSVLGLWSLAERVMLIPFVVFDSLWRVAFPAIARLVETGADVRADLERGLRIGTILTGVLLVGLAASAPLAVPVVFGERWTDAAAVIPPASLGLLILGPLSACSGGYLFAIGKPGVVLAGIAVSAAVWGAVALPLLGVIGVEAHGWGWLAASIAEALVLFVALQTRLGVRALRPILIPTLAGAAAGLAGLALCASLPATLPAALAVAVGATVLYLALLALVHRPALLETTGLARRLLPAARAVAA